MGAGGRDFHNFLTFYKNNPNYKVVAFTATQIPFIENRKFPKEFTGKLYKKDIPIYPEKDLLKLLKNDHISEVNFAYSDVSYHHLYEIKKVVEKFGARLKTLSPAETAVNANKFVIAVCGTRTGVGKGSMTKKISAILKKYGKKIAIIRHPMSYGNLRKQACQRFATIEDLDINNVTIEEREEYERHLKEGVVVYSGFDVNRILKCVEKEADVILWDGGNNDFPFLKPNLQIVVADARRVGHEKKYFPSDTTVKSADFLIINKADVVPKKNVQLVKKNLRKLNKKAPILLAKLKITVDHPELIRDKRVLCVEDGPTITHGELPDGAAFRTALEFKARSIVDPRISAVGSIKKMFSKYKHLGKVLPAVGYKKKQIKELESTINKAKCDLIIISTPVDITKLLKINKPMVKVQYEIEEIGDWRIENLLNNW